MTDNCPRGEMDITTVFGTVIPGSNPGGGTHWTLVPRCCLLETDILPTCFLYWVCENIRNTVLQKAGIV